MKRVALVCVLFPACIPDLGAPDSLVTQTEVLAIRAEPPEAAPGANVHYDMLIATPTGAVTAPASWGYCTTAKLLDENGAVSASCLGAAVDVVATGAPTVDAPVPSNACEVFGPNVTAADLRPRDPDVTGGYYQPLRAIALGQIAYALERVTCPLAFGSAQTSQDFSVRYKPNTNPVLNPILPSVPIDAVPRGAHVNFRATWPPASAETYPVFDLDARALVDHREALRVSWYATAGAFDTDRSGRADTELETFTDNGWSAPSFAGTVHVFVILRDDRGGSTFTTFDVAVP